MGMVVRSNVMAMNANRQLSVNNSSVAKSLEKLSSGFRINRAADDASGLAISEKMKAQIKGLEQASANSQDGISLIQTAEGATQEIHNMLNRMVELATKSANGTIQNEVDREAIQNEVNDLNSEITRIASSTNFNGINLLDGNLSGGSAPKVTATIGGEIVSGKAADAGKFTGTLTTAAANVSAKVEYTNAKGETKTVEVTGATGNAADIIAKLKDDKDFSELYDMEATSATALKFTAKNGGNQYSVKASVGTTAPTTTAALGTTTAGTNSSTSFTLAKNAAVGDSISVGGKTYTMAAATDAKKGEFANVADLKTLAKADGYDITAADLDAGTVITISPEKEGKGLKLQVGDTNAEYNHVSVSVDDLSAKGIGTDKVNVDSQDAAGESIQTIKDAINKVSTNRANLGSLQNRLEYTINNLDTTAENMTSANSRIRDTDMAKEMMNYTKMNILTQAAQSMLAQANQQPQAILQLLQ